MTSKPSSRSKPKLPAKQLAILAIARVAEPMAYTSVFPYLPDMIKSFGVEQNKVAKWAGVTSGVFSISQSITAVGWGKASDMYGRKPTIITGLLTTMVCFVAWGMSTSLPMAIVVRAIQGGSNGNVGIIRTMVAEMVPEKELQPRAFSIMPLVWSIGSIVGPIFGGFFAEPAKQYPALFGDIEYFKRFPFVLPNLALTVFFLISVTSAVLFLHDWGLLVGKRLTRSLRRTPAPVSSRRRSFVDGEATAPLLPSKVVLKKHSPEPTKTTKTSMMDVFTYQTVINLLAYSFLAFHSVAYDQIITVFLNYPVVEKTPENFQLPLYFTGGFGLSSGEIGTMFTLYGIVCGLIQFLVYPPLVTRYGVLRCFRVCSLVTPIVYFLTPYCVVFETSQARLAALLTVMLVKGAAIIVAFPSTTILLTNSCSSLLVLGTLNGFATTFSGIGRAVGPASTGAVFTWGADNGYAVAPWFYLMAFALMGAVPVFLIVEGGGPTASVESSDAEDSDSSASTSLLTDNSAILDDSDCEGESLQPPSYGTMKSTRT
ncbi:hypothetical protein G7Z17_g3499 [Cylindrodendrum hubeiense]|uniref:Major facilitator superfamily (MFS) profile domain-containing protein n=1 Tax=Cylindrodendrum hubeiense TaxID=595255 RepID=A0A9P5HEJ9_9HYPO|nr:hypothetical protein G7Z17_g3499 [Cylindrodendrum hubeiense]